MRNFSGLIVVAILIATILLFLGWSQVPDIVANKLSKKLKVAVEIGDIDLSLKSIEVEKIEIGNPRDCLLPRAFAADRISIDTPLTRYLHQDIEIEEIEIEGVYLGLEFDSPTSLKNNWATILDHAKSAQEEDKKETSGKTVTIRRLVLHNVQTDLVYRSKGKKVQHLPTIKKIVLKDLSSAEGSTFDQIMNSALGAMLKEVFIEQNLKDALDQLLKDKSNSDPLQEALEQFKGVFNALPQPHTLKEDSSELALDAPN